MKTKILLLFLVVAMASYGQSGTWVVDEDSLPVHVSGSSTHLVDGQIFFIGGWKVDPENPEDDYTYGGIMVYDLATESWDTTRTDMPNPRKFMGSALFDKTIYCFGGTPYNDLVEAYNTETDTWITDIPPMKYRNTGCNAITLNNLIYVGGAWDTEAPISEYFGCYNPITNSWTHLENLPYGVGHASIDTLDGLIYLCGGLCSQVGNTALKKIQVYDPLTDSWEVHSSELPNGYWSHRSFVRDRIIYMVGSSGAFYYDFYISILPVVTMFDTETGFVSEISDVPFHKCYPSVVDLGDQVFVAGGMFTDVENTPLYDVVMTDIAFYTPATNPIYPSNNKLSKSAFESINDSILLTTEFINGMNHGFTAELEVVLSDEDVGECFSLFDDGNHMDGAADDGLFGAYFTINSECYASYSIHTLNTENDEVFSSMNLGKVCSIGPIEFSSVKYYSADTIPDPGDRISLRPEFQNNGNVELAENISVKLFAMDDQLQISDYSSSVTDMQAGGGIGLANKQLTLRVSEDAIVGTTSLISIAIYASGELYWRDTAKVIIGESIIAGYNELPIELPLRFKVYPNPINESALLEFYMKEYGSVQVDIIDLSGRVYKSLYFGEKSGGLQQIPINTEQLPAGIYFVKLIANEQIAIERIVKN